MSNHRIKIMTLGQLMKHFAYQRGFREARAGKPLNPDQYKRVKHQTMYETGRLFAAISNKPTAVGLFMHRYSDLFCGRKPPSQRRKSG